MSGTTESNTWLGQLRRRKVIHWAFAYAAGALLMREHVIGAGDVWALSVTVLRGFDVVLLFGMLMVTVLAWFHGERGRQRPCTGEVAALLLLCGLGWFALTQAVSQTEGVVGGEHTQCVDAVPAGATEALRSLRQQDVTEPHQAV